MAFWQCMSMDKGHRRKFRGGLPLQGSGNLVSEKSEGYRSFQEVSGKNACDSVDQKSTTSIGALIINLEAYLRLHFGTVDPNTIAACFLLKRVTRS